MCKEWLGIGEKTTIKLGAATRVLGKKHAAEI